MQEKESKTILLEKPGQTEKAIKVEKDVQIEKEPNTQKQTEMNLKELKKEKLFTSTIIETPNYDFIEASVPKTTPQTQTEAKKDPKFRFRLIVAVYCIIIAICGIWVISNAVELNSLNSSITQSNNEYYINEAQYILKISELDAVQPDEDGSLSPIAPENIFGVQAEPLAEPTDPTVSTSWFDRVCNWLSGFFGG